MPQTGVVALTVLSARDGVQLKKAVEENNTRQLTLMNAKLNEFVLHACYDNEAM